MLWYITNSIKSAPSLAYILNVSATVDPNKEAVTSLNKFNFMVSNFLGAQFCLCARSTIGRVKRKSASHRERTWKYCFLFFITWIGLVALIFNVLINFFASFMWFFWRGGLWKSLKSAHSPSSIQHCPRYVLEPCQTSKTECFNENS